MSQGCGGAAGIIIVCESPDEGESGVIGEPVLRMCGGSDSACIDVRLNGKSRPIKFVKVLKAALDFQALELAIDA